MQGPVSDGVARRRSLFLDLVTFGIVLLFISLQMLIGHSESPGCCWV